MSSNNEFYATIASIAVLRVAPLEKCSSARVKSTINY